jgi:RNA polymerase sigma-70 factor, ECF subfamily
MDEMPADAIAYTPAAARSVRLDASVPVPARRPDRAERRLAARLRARDADALRTVYDRYGNATFGLLVRMLGDRATAEDVQQQTFAEVWRRSADYDPARAGLLTWVLTIARSRAIDHLRRRIPEPHDPHGPLALAERDAPAEEELDALLERARMAHYLGLLPDDERELLRLRFFAELSQSEIAERTGIALGTVKTRMVRGLDRLRDLLEAEEGWHR